MNNFLCWLNQHRLGIYSVPIDHTNAHDLQRDSDLNHVWKLKGVMEEGLPEWYLHPGAAILNNDNISKLVNGTLDLSRIQASITFGLHRATAIALMEDPSQGHVWAFELFPSGMCLFLFYL